jgi:hypothetical protein
MALLQKEEIQNRKKIHELEHAVKDNEEIKSRSNVARVHSWLEGRNKNSGQLVDSGVFMVWTKHHHISTVIETWRIMNV